MENNWVILYNLKEGTTTCQTICQSRPYLSQNDVKIIFKKLNKKTKQKHKDSYILQLRFTKSFKKFLQNTTQFTKPF